MAGSGAGFAGAPPSKAPSPRPKAGFAIQRICRSSSAMSKCFSSSTVVCGFASLPATRTLALLSKKSAKIAALIEGCRGKGYDPHYLGYFECFNQQLFYEAHDILEELWLARRKTSQDGFYKGLIQFAGAFVHLQKNRLKPAASLFALSRSYLERYVPLCEGLNVSFLID